MNDPVHITVEEVDKMLAKASPFTPEEVAALERYVAAHDCLSNVDMDGFRRAWLALPRLLKERRAMYDLVGGP